jgi:hypothetical protein
MPNDLGIIDLACSKDRKVKVAAQTPQHPSEFFNNQWELQSDYPRTKCWNVLYWHFGSSSASTLRTSQRWQHSDQQPWTERLLEQWYVEIKMRNRRLKDKANSTNKGQAPKIWRDLSDTILLIYRSKGSRFLRERGAQSIWKRNVRMGLVKSKMLTIMYELKKLIVSLAGNFIHFTSPSQLYT